MARKAFEQAGGEVLEVRVDAMDLDAQASLTRAGFRPLGTSVKLSARRSDLLLPDTRAGGDFSIAEAGEDDLAEIGEIVRGSHVTSHYFHGGLFESSRVRDLFVDWSERCLTHLAEGVLVARSEGRVEGFVTILINRNIAENVGTPIGTIDFVAVRPESQGRGIGSELLRAALKSLGQTCRLFEVRTELNNYPAVRTYSNLGFRLTSADHVLVFNDFRT
jgi:ribosomal protein S18 acetylase RimI-like enzyme